MDEKRLNQIFAEAKQRQMQAVKEAGKDVGGLVLPKPGVTPAMTPQEGAAASAQVGGPPEGNAIMDRALGASHDMADVIANSATFGQASKLRSAATGKTQEEVNADSDAAKARLGPGMTIAGDVGGKLALAALFPPSLYETVPAAMATSAGLGVASQVGDTLGRGKPAPSPTELLMTAGVSAAGGALGKYVGDRLGELWAKSMSQGTAPADAELYKQVGVQVGKIKQRIDAASKGMQDAEVTIRNDFLKKKVAELAKNMADNRLTYRIGQLPYAKGAVQTLQKMVADGGSPKLTELNEVRQIIRDSVLNTNGALNDAVTPTDAKAVKLIDGYLRNIMSNLGSTPEAVGSGNVTQAVASWKVMNSLVPQQAKANLIASALDRADLASKQSGISFDRALASQFGQLYKGAAGQAEFRGAEREMLRELAEGTSITQNLNKFDRMFGHGMLSGVYNTLARIPRGATSRTATQNARDILGNLAPEAAVSAPSKVPGTLGAIMGQSSADKFIGENVKLVPRQ